MSDSNSSSSSSISSEESDDEDYFDFDRDRFIDDVRRLRENDPALIKFVALGSIPYFAEDIREEEWEQLGRDISNNSYLKKLELVIAIDDQKMASLFRGLTGSSSIEAVILNSYRCGFNGVQSMVPFLQNVNNLLQLGFCLDNITSEGFKLLFRALRDSPIQIFNFHCCGLSSFEIDDDYVPNNLQTLFLPGNDINADGCRELAKLLRRENATLQHLCLENNKIDDEGISYLVNALQTNTSLYLMNLHGNEGVTIEGMQLVLKLLNDISSIKATHQSNHTLFSMRINESFEDTDIGRQIKQVLRMNKKHIYNSVHDNPDKTGKLKVIRTQLDSKVRSEMCSLQGLADHTKAPLTDLGPLLLPEVLELVGKHHGLSKFYESFREAASDIWTTINREAVLHQKRVELAEELDVLAAKRHDVESQLKDVDIEIASIGQQSQYAACDGSHKSKRQKIS